MSNISRWDLLREYFVHEARDLEEDCRIYNMEDVQDCPDFKHMEPAFEKYCHGTECPKCPFSNDCTNQSTDVFIVAVMDDIEEMARVQTKDPV